MAYVVPGPSGFSIPAQGNLQSPDKDPETGLDRVGAP